MIISNQGMNGRIDEFHGTPPAPQCICTRCGGLLVNELSIDLWSCTNELEHGARRCVQCGDVLDPVISRNRRIRQEPMTVQRDGNSLARNWAIGRG